MLDLSKYETLGDDAHINLRTFRQDDTPVDTPVWFEYLNGHYFVRTVSGSAKVRRLRANPLIQFASCRWNGELLGPWQQGSARLVPNNDPRLPDIDRLMDKKYGAYRQEMTDMMKDLGKSLCFIEITPEQA